MKKRNNRQIRSEGENCLGTQETKDLPPHLVPVFKRTRVFALTLCYCGIALSLASLAVDLFASTRYTTMLKLFRLPSLIVAILALMSASLAGCIKGVKGDLCQVSFPTSIKTKVVALLMAVLGLTSMSAMPFVTTRGVPERTRGLLLEEAPYQMRRGHQLTAVPAYDYLTKAIALSIGGLGVPLGLCMLSADYCRYAAGAPTEKKKKRRN